MAEELKPKRLCSEIQLFDICAKDECEDKKDRFCNNSEILSKFEAISEDDDSLQDQYLSEEEEDLEDFDEIDYDDDPFEDIDADDDYEGREE